MKPTLHTTDTSTLKRAGTLGIFVAVAFAFLLLRILALQTIGFEKYRDKVLNQITTETEVVAERGKIYDRNGVLLATSVTTYRVFIAPRIPTESLFFAYSCAPLPYLLSAQPSRLSSEAS